MQNHYHLDLVSGGTHDSVLSQIPAGCRVLDVGCATGYLGSNLRQKGCEVSGIDINQSAIDEIPTAVYKHLICANLDDCDAAPFGAEFDVIVAADVLEHCLRPERVLALLLEMLRPKGRIIVSLPNVAHASVRLALLVGRFEYADIGILDRTHLHLYTRASARRLVEEAGLTITRELVGSRLFGSLLNSHPVALKLLAGFCATNVIFVAEIEEEGHSIEDKETIPAGSQISRTLRPWRASLRDVAGSRKPRQSQLMRIA